MAREAGGAFRITLFTSVVAVGATGRGGMIPFFQRGFGADSVPVETADDCAEALVRALMELPVERAESLELTNRDTLEGGVVVDAVVPVVTMAPNFT